MSTSYGENDEVQPFSADFPHIILLHTISVKCKREDNTMSD